MKTHSIIILPVLLSIALLTGCEKDNTDKNDPKDYAASISEKTWSGEITYTGDSVQYYTVHFNADKTLEWSQFSGDYPGNWELTGKQLTMTFAGNNVAIKAGITNDDQWENIEANTNLYKVNGGKRIENPNMSLENVTWNAAGFKGGFPYYFEVSFLPGNEVYVTSGVFIADPSPYTRSASGAAIRFNGLFPTFAVIMSNNELKGSVISTVNPWRSKK